MLQHPLVTEWYCSFDKYHVTSKKTDLPFPKQALVFTCLQCKPFENTAGKGEIARDEQFLLFLHCFLPIRITFCHFCQVQNCHLQTLSV